MGFARNVHFTIKDGQLDEFNRVFTTEINPMLEGTPKVEHDDRVVSMPRT